MEPPSKIRLNLVKRKFAKKNGNNRKNLLLVENLFIGQFRFHGEGHPEGLHRHWELGEWARGQVQISVHPNGRNDERRDFFRPGRGKCRVFVASYLKGGAQVLRSRRRTLASECYKCTVLTLLRKYYKNEKI